MLQCDQSRHGAACCVSSALLHNDLLSSSSDSAPLSTSLARLKTASSAASSLELSCEHLTHSWLVLASLLMLNLVSSFVVFAWVTVELSSWFKGSFHQKHAVLFSPVCFFPTIPFNLLWFVISQVSLKQNILHEWVYRRQLGPLVKTGRIVLSVSFVLNVVTFFEVRTLRGKNQN